MKLKTKLVFTPEEREFAKKVVDFLTETEDYLDRDFFDEVVMSVLMAAYSTGEITKED